MLRHAASVGETAESRALASKLADMLIMVDTKTIMNGTRAAQGTGTILPTLL
jgi:hypothetical protein